MSEIEEATRAPVEEGADSGAGKRLPPAIWAEICAHWECGTMTAAEMSKKYDVTPSAMSRYFGRNGIVRNSKKVLMKKAAEEKVLGTAIAAESSLGAVFEAKRADRIAETREHAFNLSRANLGRGMKIFKEITDGIKKEADCAGDFKALRHVEMLIEKNLANRLKALKADQDIDTDDLPTLVFRDLSQEEIKELQAQDREEFDFDLPDAPGDLTDDEIIEEDGAGGAGGSSAS